MILTINGIKNSASTTTDRMADALNQQHGIKTVRLRYPVRRGWESRNRHLQYTDASIMLGQIQKAKDVNPNDPVDIVAHSHGCLLTARMMELGGTDIFRNVTFFAPALDKDWIFPLHAFKRLTVVHHKKDRAIWFAGLLPMSHPWGCMGRDGHAPTKDARIVNLEDKTRKRRFTWRMHSHYFTGANLKKYTDHVADKYVNLN